MEQKRISFPAEGPSWNHDNIKFWKLSPDSRLCIVIAKIDGDEEFLLEEVLWEIFNKKCIRKRVVQGRSVEFNSPESNLDSLFLALFQAILFQLIQQIGQKSE